MESLLYIAPDYVVFFQGISFVILAAVTLPLMRQGGDGFPWFLVALFALFYGLSCLFPLLSAVFNVPQMVMAGQALLAFTAFIFLGEFALRSVKFFSGRSFRRRLLLPLLAAFIVIAGYIGLDFLLMAIHSGPGAMSAFCVALAFWQSGQKAKKAERLPLQAAGLFFLFLGLIFATYFLPVLIAAAPPLIPSLPLLPLWSTPSATHLKLAYLFLSGLAALCVAFSFSRLSLLGMVLSRLSPYFGRKSQIYLYTSIFIVIGIIVGGWPLTNVITNYFMEKARSGARLDAELMSDHLAGVLDALNQGAMLMANLKTISQAVTDQEKNNEEVVEELRNAAWIYRLQRCLVVDMQGKVIASDRTTGEIIPDKLDPSHPTLAAALTGSRGYNITFDRRWEVPIYLTAFPVRGLNGEIKGALVMEKNIEAAEFFLKKHPYAFHLSPEGVILLASQPNLRRMTLWPLTPEVQKFIANNREYDFPLRGAILDARPQGDILTYKGLPHLLVRSFHQWSIHIMTPVDTVLHNQLVTILLLFLLVTVTLVFFLDSQQLLKTSASLLGAEKRFQLIFQNVPGAIFILAGPEAQIISENDYVYKWLGYGPEELRKMTMRDIRLDVPRADGLQSYRKKDGTIVDVEEVMADITIDDQVNQLLIAHDVTERNRAEEELRLAREFSDSVIKTAAALIVVLDRQGVIRLFNDHAEQLTGWRREEVLGRRWFDLFIPEAELSGVEEVFQTLLRDNLPLSYENPIITKERGTRIIAWNNTVLKDKEGQALLVIATGIDVTEQRAYEETLKKLSLVDGLTGVANRRSFDDFFARHWRLAAREGSPISLIMADIDFFKRYNDALGHQAGDNCLIQVAAAMQTAIRRPLDLVARYGGEEFVVVMPDTGRDGALKVAEEIRRRLRLIAMPHPDSEVGSLVTMSYGVSSAVPCPGMSGESLITAADQALYLAKNRGRNRIEYLGITEEGRNDEG